MKVRGRQALLKGVREALRRSHAYFSDTQHPEGYWWGELESNPTMEAEYLLLSHFLGVADPARWRKIANHIASGIVFIELPFQMTIA